MRPGGWTTHMGNRVEELEREVAELRAAVDGLTEELVETKERVATLEAGDEPTETTTTRETGSSHAEFVPNHSADDHAEDESDDTLSTGSEAEIVDADAADTGGGGASGGSSGRSSASASGASDSTDASEAETTATDDDNEDSDGDIIVA